MLFQIVSDYVLGQHQFRCYELSNADWLAQVATEYVALRTACNFNITSILLDGVDVLNPAVVQARLQAATVPVSTGGNFDIVRSDLGEVLTYMILGAEYGTSFGYLSVRDRELIQLQGRGIDAVGLEEGHDGKLILCLGEAKVSDAAASPPGVVDAAGDSLRNQHRGHLSDLKATASKLWDLGRRARSEAQQNLFFTAAMCFEEDSLDDIVVVATCVLVRPAERYTEADFGTFRSAPDDYLPAIVRFLVMRIPDGVTATVQAFIEAIKEVAA